MPENKDNRPLPIKGMLPLGTEEGIDLNQQYIPKLENASKDIGIDLNKNEFDKKFGNTNNYLSDNNYEKLRKNQSNWDRFGNTLARIGSNIVGGTISSIGSVGAITEGIYDEINNKDADFKNSVTEFGDNIKEWGKENFPNYREHPGKSFDVSDPAWWFEGAESTASTLEFMLGGIGAVKGVGLLSKLVKAEQILAKTGANVNKLKFATKIGVSASYSRNAENVMESLQIKNSTKKDLLEEWNNNPESFEKLKNSDIVKELQAENREVTPENLANFISGKAAWKTYAINSANIVFDTMQMIPIFKGFDANTRKGLFNTKSAINIANENLLKSGQKQVKASLLNKTFDILNPAISGIGRSASEGVEEVINYIGGEEGKNDANKLSGKKTEDLGDRLSKYFKSGELYESAFWGTLGGVVGEGGGRAANKLFNLSKGIKSNTETDTRIGEINNRINILKEASTNLKNINSSDNTEEDKKYLVNKVKSELSLNLGFSASKHGNIDLLLQQIQSDEYKNKLIELGIADEDDIDKAINNTVNDVLISENLYKKHINTFQYATNNDEVRNSLVSESVITDFFIKKNEEKNNKLNNELAELKQNDPFITNSKNKSLESLIELKSLQTVRASINDFISNAENKEEDILSNRGKEKLEQIDLKINELKKQTKEDNENLSDINPEIINKQAQIILNDTINYAQKYNVANLSKTSTITKKENEAKQRDENIDKISYDNFVSDVENKINNNLLDLESLKTLQNNTEKGTKENKFLQEKINDYTSKNDIINRKEEVKTAFEEPTNTLYGEHPDYIIENLDETKVAPYWKEGIDKLLNEKDSNQLLGFTNDSFKESNPYEAIYTRNKIQEAKNVNKQTQEINSKPIIDIPIFEFNEYLENSKEEKERIVTIDQIKDGIEEKENTDEVNLDFFAENINEDPTRIGIPLFNPANVHEFFKFVNGNILVKDKDIELIKTLFNEDFKQGVDLEIHWDKSNVYTKEEGRGNKNEEAFKIVYKGVTIGYLGRISAINYEIRKAKEQNNENLFNRLNLELVKIQKIRNSLELSDKIFKTKLLTKVGSTSIRSNNLRPIKGIFDTVWALNPGRKDTKTSLINLTNQDESFETLYPLSYGRIYGGLKDANGIKRPIALEVSNLNLEQATKIKTLTDELLTVLNTGKTTKNQEVKDIENELSKLVQVDRRDNFDKLVGYRYFPQGVNEEGNITESRIEIGFKNKDGGISKMVVKKSIYDNSTYVGIFTNDNKISELKNGTDSTYFLDLLTRKKHNVNFANIQKQEKYTFNNKTYNTYLDYLINEEIIQTDLAQIVDKNGNVVSNIFSFNNKFGVYIDSNLENYLEEKTIKELNEPVINEPIIEKQEDVDVSNIFLDGSYEKEFNSNNDNNFKNNYTIYNDNKTVNAITILKEILKNPLTDNIKNVAEFLLKNASKINVEILVNDINSGHPAIFEGNKNRIVVSRNGIKNESFFQKTILHELIHVPTVKAVFSQLENSNEAYKLITTNKYKVANIQDFKFKEGTEDYIKEFFNDIVNTYNISIRKIEKKYGKSAGSLFENNKDNFYGLSNPFEFMSEIMTNISFRNEVIAISNPNFIERFYNNIVDFLNKLFNTKYNKIKTDLVKQSVNKIKDFIENVEETTKKVPFSFQTNLTDNLNNEFSLIDSIEIINTLEGIIVNTIKNKNVNDINNIFANEKTTQPKSLKAFIKENLTVYNDKYCPESCKIQTTKIIKHFDVLYDKSYNNIKKSFKIEDELSYEDIENSQELNKEFDDSGALKIASQDTITKEIKLFIKGVPLLKSTNVTFDKNNNPIWDISKSSLTGMSLFIDFNTIYPYLVRNLIGAKNGNDIIKRLNRMAKFNPSFAYISNELSKNANLLAQFQVNLANKYAYDSLVIFISNYNSGKEIYISNELKSSKYDYIISNNWNKNINDVIDKLKDSTEKILDFKKQEASLRLKIETNKKSRNIEELASNLQEYANLLGVDISLPVIVSGIENLQDLSKINLYNKLIFIKETIINDKGIFIGTKNSNFGNLNSLAKLEALIRYDIVENSGLDIKGNMIYAVRNPNFISNYFTDIKNALKSDDEEFTKEARKELDIYLTNLSKIPSMQNSNLLWNEPNSLGMIFYDIKNGIKTPIITKEGFIKINTSFFENFNFHDFGGAKETLSKNTQQYNDFSENDWKFVNLLNYIKPKEKSNNNNLNKDYCYIPSLIPSDSSSMKVFSMPRIKLQKNEYTLINGSFKLNKNSTLFKAVYNTALQEIKTIQQAQNEIFDIINNNLVFKKDLDFNKLQQHYHYGKEIIYNEDGSVNLESTFFYTDAELKKNSNLNSKFKGNSFNFHNMLVKNSNGDYESLNNVKGLKINDIILEGSLTTEIQNEIVKYVNTFIEQQVLTGIQNYKFLKEDVVEKHDEIADGTFEGLISEYVLNHYIHNVEQFNFFNGNLAEYKSKIDSNKRAKQIFAPGQALALEAMKMVYENGNTSNGRNFTAFTIKDIITTSNTIDFKIEEIKKQIIKEKNYFKEEISNFRLQAVSKNLKDKSNLENDIYKILKGYFNINSGDAQGYMTLDRYESLQRGLGNYNPKLIQAIKDARAGKATFDQLQLLQPVKGFYYGRTYDSLLNKLTSNQIKYSSIPLIPQLVENTELKKLMDFMNEKAIDEAFFESAHKIGAKNIHKINNEDGTINENSFKKIIPAIYENRYWQLQLTTPEHLVDTEILLATQIAKIIIGNLPIDNEYSVNGKVYKSNELINHYFKVLDNNITESATDLLNDLGVIKTDTGYIITDKELQKILLEEVEKNNNISDNYSYAIELNNNGEFKLPLFSNNMATKWEAILTSLFTNRIIKQKTSGGSVVLGSRLFLDNTKLVTLKNTNIEGIEWSKEKQNDKNLKSYNRKEDSIKVVEVLLGAWSKDLYQEGQRISINDIPNEVKTMIGYRIPTQAKHSMVVFEVVGFLPEQSKGMIIMPDDIVTQMGSDFDIDKLYIMNKHFYRNDNNEFIIPNIYNEKEEFKKLQKEKEDLDLLINSFTNNNEAEGTLLGDIFNRDLKEDSKKEIELLNKRLNNINKRLKEITIKDNENNIQWDVNGSKKARQNEIFNIYESILTNEKHFKEIFTPAEFEGFIKLKKKIENIYNENDDYILPTTEEGQRLFRRRNISGSALKGIAANLNAFGSIAQVSKMEINKNNSFNFKFNLKSGKYKKDELEKRYKEDVTFDENFAYIKFNKLGFAPDGTFLNVDGKLILEEASQGIAAAVDGVKDPTFDTFNATTYTYPLFHTMLLAGVPVELAGMFIRQPILKSLNDLYFDNKSLLADKNGKEIELEKRKYQTTLAIYLYKDLDKKKELIKLLAELEKEYKDNPKEIFKEKIKNIQEKVDNYNKVQKLVKKRKDNNISNNDVIYDDKYLIWLKREDTESFLQYNPDELISFDAESLENNLKLNSRKLKDEKGNKVSDKDIITYIQNQLQIIEAFNDDKKVAEKVQDYVRVTKTDGLGAGPSMGITNNLIKSINKLKLNTIIQIDNKPAVLSLYPKTFINDKEVIDKYENISNIQSSYLPLESYLENGNKLSIDVLGNIFITQSKAFLDFQYTLTGRLKRTLTEDETSQINKFLNINLLQDFDALNTIDKNQILGINQEKNIETKLDIETFKNLSTANQVAYMKVLQQEFLSKNPQHILNFLNPLLRTEDIDKNKYHKLDFEVYKNINTDDNLTTSIIDYYYSNDEFEKELGKSLINYAFVTNGLSFGFKSFAKVVPNEILIELGLNEFLNKQKELVNTVNFDDITLDVFFRNNWNNTDFVPSMSTQWEYEIVNGKKKVKVLLDDITGEEFRITKSNTPIWDFNSSTIIVTEKALKKTNDKIINALYISLNKKINNKIETKLYKKYEEKNETEGGAITYKSSFDGKIFYYEVEKLGTDSINEFNEKSIFHKLVQDNKTSIEDTINNIKKQQIKNTEGTNAFKLDNTTKEEDDDIKNNCKIN